MLLLSVIIFISMIVFVSVENSEPGQTRNTSYSLGNAFTFLKSSGRGNFLNIKVLCSLHFESMHSNDSFWVIIFILNCVCLCFMVELMFLYSYTHVHTYIYTINKINQTYLFIIFIHLQSLPFARWLWGIKYIMATFFKC